jgi:dTMP kinase
MAGLFFSFDGVDGVGKSTQLRAFVEWLEQLGQEVVTCRDPGGTVLGESVREILLHKTDIALALRAEMLLYMASRAQLVDEIIRPALSNGKTVVSDRYLLANVVYQGHATDLGPDAVWAVGEVATTGIAPDATFLLDMEVPDAVERLSASRDRMEARGIGYMERVRQGFLREADRQPDRIATIDASQPIDVVQQGIREVAADVLRRLEANPTEELP